MSNLLETVSGSGSFNRLMTAVKAAGLEETLKAPGPITVLAPTDAAFDKLPSEATEALLQDIPRLKRVVMYHIISGDVRSDDLQQIDEAPTFEGSIVAVDASDGIKVNDATVTETDILTDNGVIHVIDSVLIPSFMNDL